MLPAGKITEETIEQLAGLMKPGDVIIDGGNTNFKDDVRRARELAPKGIQYLDVGTSGGVWGLQRGYCLMIGGDTETVKRLDPIFSALAPGVGRHRAHQGAEGEKQLDPRAEQGYMHAGPVGAGHFVKMIHNGIEYGMMQAFAEGFDIMTPSRFGEAAGGRALRSQSRRRRRSLAARQRGDVVAARPDGERTGQG